MNRRTHIAPGWRTTGWFETCPYQLIRRVGGRVKREGATSGEHRRARESRENLRLPPSKLAQEQVTMQKPTVACILEEPIHVRDDGWPVERLDPMPDHRPPVLFSDLGTPPTRLVERVPQEDEIGRRSVRTCQIPGEVGLRERQGADALAGRRADGVGDRGQDRRQGRLAEAGRRVVGVEGNRLEADVMARSVRPGDRRGTSRPGHGSRDGWRGARIHVPRPRTPRTRPLAPLSAAPPPSAGTPIS